jgi:hypothetical protein
LEALERLLLAPTSLFVAATKPSRWHVYPANFIGFVGAFLLRRFNA